MKNRFLGGAAPFLSNNVKRRGRACAVRASLYAVHFRPRELSAQEIKQRLFVYDLALAADAARSSPAAQRHFAGAGLKPWSFIGNGLEPRDKTAFIRV